jgi:hypothetical protein
MSSQRDTSGFEGEAVRQIIDRGWSLPRFHGRLGQGDMSRIHRQRGSRGIMR